MSQTVLVAYATRYGSTQEVAEAIAEALKSAGLVIDIQPIRDVHSLDNYAAIILGAPLFMFQWHKDALSFLSKYESILAQKPVVVFATGPVHDPHDEQEWLNSRGQLDKELAKFPWF